MRILKSRKTETSTSSPKEIKYPCKDCVVKAICSRDLFVTTCDEYFEWFTDNLIVEYKEGEDGNES